MHARLLTATALALVLGAAGSGSSALAQPYGGGWMGGYGPGYGMMDGYGPGCYGPAMMYGGCGNGPGYTMGPGYGPRIGYGPGYGQGDLNLSTDKVRDYLARWIVASGNSHLKVGDVKEQGTDAITADIVTQDNSLVQEFLVDRHTGFYHPEQTAPSNPTIPSKPTGQK